MRTVRAARGYDATVADVERLWYDLARWPSLVEGFHHVVSVEGEWPAAPSTLVWESGPNGRGRVVEEVVRHEPGWGQRAEVEDERMRGVREVRFTRAPAGDGAQVHLSLGYELKQSGPLGPLTDLLFIRRACRDALARELARLAAELRAERELGA